MKYKAFLGYPNRIGPVRNENKQTFMPFLLAIIDKECQASCEHLLREVDKFIGFSLMDNAPCAN